MDKGYTPPPIVKSGYRTPLNECLILRGSPLDGSLVWPTGRVAADERFELAAPVLQAI